MDIPSTVTELGAETFRGCGNLKDVKIPSGITRIQDGTFRDCNSLENMEIPSSVINIGNGAFGDCEGLKSIKILNPDCVISDDFIAPPDANILYGYAIPGNATIYGYNNSTAQAYAKKHNRKFITLMEQTENTIQSLTVEDMGGILNDTIKTTGKLTLVNNGQNSSDMLKEEVKKIQWISSDPEIAEVTECTIKNVISNLSSEIEICITPYQAGTVTITGITSDQNIKANCKIIVEPKLDLTIETEKDTAIIKGNVRYVSNGGEVDPDYLKQYMEGLSYIVVTNENATALEETASYEILTGGYGAEYTLMLKMVDNTAEIQPFEVQFISAGGNCWYLHATLCKTDGYFRIKVDSNNFDHEDIGESHDNDMSKKIGSAYVTSLDYYSKLVSGLSWDEEIAILSEMNVEEWTGSCFGASVSMALANLELFNVKALGAEDGNYYSLKSPMENEDLRDAINFYHLLQYRKDCDPNKVIYNDMKTSLHKWCSENVVFNQKSFWKAFLSAVYTNVENKRPMIFSMGYKDGDGEIRGHSVIVCGIDDTNSQYYNIKMYDLNNTYSYTCLQISKTFDKFWYIGSVDVSHNNWKFLHYMEYDTLYKMSQLADSIDAKNRLAIKSNGVSAPVLQNPSSIIVSAYSKFYLENSQGQYLSYDGTNYSGNIDIYGVRLVGENKNQKFIFTVEGDNQYKLSDFTDGISFGTIIDGTSYMTTASSANTITINGKDGISFSGSKIKFSGEISDNESYKLIKFNGLSESDVNIKKENKNVIAKSQNGINDLSVDLISNNSSKIHKDIKYGTDFNVNVDTGKIEYAGDTDSDIVENFTVIFNTQNDVTAPEPYKNIRKGSTITPPVEPVLSGYLFLGWYKDTECTVLWNFASDVVLSDMTLYAGWKIDENIPDQPSVPDDNYDGIFPEDIPADGRIPEGLWISEIKDYAYNGKPIKPTLRVYFSRKLLREGWDYTISYKNNIKAADAASNKAPKIIIKCKNDYTGTISSTFTIKKGQLTSDNLIYTETHPKGKMYTPLLVLNGNILKAKVDYIVTYTKNGQKVKSPSKSGIYEIHVIGKNSCEGDFTVPLTVLEGGITSITKAKVTIKSMTYGNKPPKAVLVVNGQTLRENTDYLVTYVNTDAKGTATAIFQGKGKYSGVVKKTFKVAAAKLPGGCITVTGDTSLKKGGAKPQITVQVNGVKLIAGVDYTVSYKNNKKAGKQATVIVKGKGNYSGSQKATFTVKTL